MSLKLNEKVKAALFFTLGMGLFLTAGSLVYYFPKLQLIEKDAVNKTADTSSSIEDLYRDLRDKDSENQVSKVIEVEQYEIERKKAEADDRWVLYVTGSVKNPGVYKLPPEARVFQLVDAAGGLAARADVLAVNMAARLQDGDHLHVPIIEENSSPRDNRSPPSSVESRRTAIVTQDKQRDSIAINNKKSNKNPPGKSIDLNTASAAELMTLPRIGPAMSERIIQYRKQNGRFNRVSDLLNVSGIGAKMLESIEPYLFVR